MRTLVILALVACRGDREPAARGSAAGVDDLAAVLEPIRAAHEVPALGAAVWRDDELVAIGVAGVRAAGHDQPATVDDRWHLGSDTKAMTAVLIAIYVDRGVLHWTDTLDQLFPAVHADYAKVTLDQLLQHRAGLPANGDNAMLASETADHGRAKFAERLLALPPAQPPGTFVYSNAGYVIAATALEARTKKSWDQLIRDEVWTPLHMTSCGLGPPGAASLDQPWGHVATTSPTANDPWQSTRQFEPISPQSPRADNPAGLGPAGTAHCSLRDWGKFLTFVMHGARHDKTALLAAATFDHLLTPPTGGDYMGGWMFVDRPWAGGRALNHAGSNTMWFANTWIAPNKRTVLAVVENVHDEATGEAVLGELLKRYVK